jgi:hypothetical protein
MLTIPRSLPHLRRRRASSPLPIDNELPSNQRALLPTVEEASELVEFWAIADTTAMGDARPLGLPPLSRDALR